MDPAKILTSTISQITRPFPELHNLPERMAAQESDILSAVGQERGAVWVAFGPLRSGWSLAVVIPQAEMLENADALRVKTLTLGIVGVLLLAGARDVAGATRGPADLPARRIRRSDRCRGARRPRFRVWPRETRSKHWHAHSLKCATPSSATSRRRLGSRPTRRGARATCVSRARSRWASCLPSFERIIGDAPIEIAATLLPARGVGGDLYDAFPLGPGQLCIVAGDVSGKGIPAAMFMAMATTALRSIAREVDEPGQMLARLNDQLAEENPSQTFLTVFCGVLDIASGRLSYASGGHTNPVLLREGDAPRFTVSDAGNLVGCVPDLLFPRGQLQLLAGDVVILYTDGVTEALNEEDELFGEERLLESFGERSGRTAQDVVDELVAAVQAFAGDAPQADDIGILNPSL